MANLRQDDLRKHIQQAVPEEHQKCMVGMKRNLKQTLEIAETVSDPKTKLQARAIANDFIFLSFDKLQSVTNYSSISTKVHDRRIAKDRRYMTNWRQNS